MPYTLEAVTLLNDGLTAGNIDRAATSFGMPMGPLAMADTVGLDICLDVAENLGAEFGFDIPERLRKIVSQGQLGKKTGNGFYTWKNGKPVITGHKNRAKLGSKGSAIVDRTQQRLIYRYLNECIACLDEKIVENQNDLDAAMVFGTGFAPFRGGPLNYLVNNGVDQEYGRLLELHEEYGERFTPHPGWKNPVNFKLAE